MRRCYDQLFLAAAGPVCHLRLYIEEARAVAIATQLTDGAGPSVVNAAEALHASIAEAFVIPPERLQVICHMPGNDVSDELWSAFDAVDADFRRQTAHEVEEMIGETPLGLTEDQATTALLGGKCHPAMALRVVEDPERLAWDDVATVATADLPWPHGPFRCPHNSRFEAILERLPPGWASHPAAGAQWYLSLTDADFAACPFHQADWQRIAEVSVELRRRMPTGADAATLNALLAELCPDDPERTWVRSLFTDPIHYDVHSDRVGNGQHRACALRASGAPCAVADTDSPGRPRPRDPRRVARADLAAFWSAKAADDD